MTDATILETPTGRALGAGSPRWAGRRWRLLRYAARHVAPLLVTLFVVSVMVFVLVQLLPGDVGRTILGPDATPEQVAQIEAELGYDRPVLVRYADFATSFVTGDWGESVRLRTDVRPLVGTTVANSVRLAVLAMLIALPLALAAGVWSGLHEGSLADRAITMASVGMLGIPLFVTAVILLLVFSVNLQWAPVNATPPDGAGLATQIGHTILPAVPIALVLFAYIARHVRAATVDTIGSDFVRTAVLKGVTRRRVVLRHVLPNSLLSTVTVVGQQLGAMVGGLIVIETLFTYDGVGKLMYDAAKTHDVPLLMPATVVVAAFYMVCNLLADLALTFLDPRIRYTR